jgi:beta-N-acetylhexosaminidase
MADMVMVGHVHHAAWSQEGEPATFSRPLLNGELRDELGFKGVAISDDLEMGAIRHKFGIDEAIVRAIGAGIDMVILSNMAAPRADLPHAAYKTLSEAIKPQCPPGKEASCVPEARIAEAYKRVVRLKLDLDERRSRTSGACVPLKEKPRFTSICQGKEQVASWWNWIWR